MRTADRLEQLRQASVIREVQRIAAEGRAARAASALRESEALKSEREHLRFASEQGWLDAVSCPTLSMDVTRLWAAEVVQRDTFVVRASANVESASNELRLKTEAFHAARMHCDIAQELHDRARKDDRKRREEDGLHDASDRHSYRGWEP